MSSSWAFVIIASIMMAALVVDTGECVFLPKRANGYDGRDSILDPKKRPFCNAFTGCGRKRSNLPAMPMQSDPNTEETIGSLLELSAEPAVEDLSRQIMSEAKLWEAIQEANIELLRRKQLHRQESVENNLQRQQADEPATPARSATASCALPPCYI